MLFIFTQLMFFVAKAKRQLQLRQGEIDFFGKLMDIFEFQTHLW